MCATSVRGDGVAASVAMSAGHKFLASSLYGPVFCARDIATPPSTTTTTIVRIVINIRHECKINEQLTSYYRRNKNVPTPTA